MLYQFTQPVRVQDSNHEAGEVVDDSLLPIGSLDGLLRRVWIAPYQAPSNVAPEPAKSTNGKRK